VRSLPPSYGDLSRAIIFAPTLGGACASMDQTSSIGHERAGGFAVAPSRSGFSLLRLSVPARLAIVGAITVLLWALVWLWALS
jgi:hypothetical protein